MHISQLRCTNAYARMEIAVSIVASVCQANSASVVSVLFAVLAAYSLREMDRGSASR